METKAGKTVKGKDKRGQADEQGLSLSYARTLSWLSLLIVLMVSLGLSYFISNQTRTTLMERQEGLAVLLAHNLNNQIFQRFAVPTIRDYGHISLRNEKQRELMDSVVRSVIVGLPVSRLRVYEPSGKGVTYSTVEGEFGRMDLVPDDMSHVLRGEPGRPVIQSSLEIWEIPFHWPLKPGTIQLTTLFPLRGDAYLLRLAAQEYLAKELDLPPNFTVASTPLMGVLEVTQDITGDYVQVLLVQVAIVVMCLLSSIIMFALLLLIIHRAESVLKARLQKNLQLEKELQSTERLVSMGRVVASIAHEIRNPLGIIRSTVDLLQKRTANSSDKGTQRLLVAMHDETLRLSQTVNDFLDYARPRQPKQDPVELELVLSQIVAFVGSDFERAGISLSVHVEGDLWVLGDKDLLYRAFYNVLVNGRQAITGQGSLEVTAKARGDKAVLAFKDSGPGFDTDIIDKSFEPFFTTKDGGTGLGLPIVHSIITSHGGEVHLANAEEGGAIVEVVLPLAPQSSEPKEAVQKETASKEAALKEMVLKDVAVKPAAPAAVQPAVPAASAAPSPSSAAVASDPVLAAASGAAPDAMPDIELEPAEPEAKQAKADEMPEPMLEPAPDAMPDIDIEPAGQEAPPAGEEEQEAAGAGQPKQAVLLAPEASAEKKAVALGSLGEDGQA